MTLSYRHSSHNREFHNVNCSFCGAIHSVNWACISVLSQVIHSVNERKTVQTNMISFVSHGDKTLQRLVGMPGEQKHNISFIPFFFFITYKILTCERALISALQVLKKHHRICGTTSIKLRFTTRFHGYGRTVHYSVSAVTCSGSSD